MKREIIKVVPKVWGQERHIINCDEYCGKFLDINAGASCSLHAHHKRETFVLLSGMIALEVEDEKIVLLPSSMPVTILPDQYHRFTGIEDSTIIEFSTHHSDEDIVRREPSKGSIPNGNLS